MFDTTSPYPENSPRNLSGLQDRKFVYFALFRFTERSMTIPCSWSCQSSRWELLRQLFEDANLCVIHATRVTIMPKDFLLHRDCGEKLHKKWNVSKVAWCLPLNKLLSVLYSRSKGLFFMRKTIKLPMLTKLWHSLTWQSLSSCTHFWRANTICPTPQENA